MTLHDLLDAYRRHCEDQWSTQARDAWARRLERIRASGVFADALKVGDHAPDLIVPAAPADEPGEPDIPATTLHRMLADGPVVLKFVPGRGCPYTTLELRAYQRMVEQIRALGGQLLAFSARDAQDVALHRARDALSFPIIADPQRVAASRFGVVVPALPGGQDADGADAALGDPPSVLPATFVIGTDRRIAFAFVDPDPRERAEPAVVARALAAVASGGMDRNRRFPA